MYCEKCGKKNDDHAKHCEGCGAALPGAGTAGAPAPVVAPPPAGVVAAAPDVAPLGHLAPLVVVALLLYLPRSLWVLFLQAGQTLEIEWIQKFMREHTKGVDQAFLLFNVLELVSFILIITTLFCIVGARRREPQTPNPR